MKLATVRAVDYYLGIPICFLLSCWNRLLTLFIRPKEVVANSVKNILIIELSEMGSTILGYSAMRYAKQAFPKAKLFFLIFKKNAECVELLDIIDNENILTISDESFGKLTRDTLRFLFLAHNLHFDLVYDLELFSRFTSILSYLSGAPFRAGFHRYTTEGLYRGNLLTHPVFYNTHIHIGYNMLALIKAPISNVFQLVKESISNYELSVPPFTPDTKLLGEFKAAIPIKVKKPVILINPNPGKLLPIRNWGIEKFARVAKVLAQENNALIVVIGLPEAKADALEIMKQSNYHPSIVDFTGRTKNLYELLHVFSIADALLTNDSGPAHFAAMTPLSIFTLFGPETPELYGPLSPKAHNFFSRSFCSPCLTARNHRHTTCCESLCLQQISVDEVINTMRLKLGLQL